MMLIILMLGLITSSLVTHYTYYQIYQTVLHFFVSSATKQNEEHGAFGPVNWLGDYRNEGSVVCTKWNCWQILCKKTGRTFNLPQNIVIISLSAIFV